MRHEFPPNNFVREHSIGPESHSVHTLKSTKIVVEENSIGSTCDDVEVEDLMKRIQKQRGILDEILSEKNESRVIEETVEKCETQPEGTPNESHQLVSLFSNPSTPTPPQWNENDRKFMISLSPLNLFSLIILLITKSEMLSASLYCTYFNHATNFPLHRIGLTNFSHNCM